MAEMQRTAVISEGGTFRYRLGRRWADGAPLLFVMLNPSTPDHEQDDATIRRCIRFAQAHNFPALEVVNLFAYRATDPKDLRASFYPIGPENDAHTVAAAREAGALCVAWGAHAAGLERPQIVLPLLRSVGKPMMLPSSCRLMPFCEETVEEATRA
jgi:hypothetical protein